MMRFYGGALSYTEIMAMPYKAFMMLYEYMVWQLREQDEKGKKTNDRIRRTDIARAFGSKALRRQESQGVQEALRQIKNTKT